MSAATLPLAGGLWMRLRALIGGAGRPSAVRRESLAREMAARYR